MYLNRIATIINTKKDRILRLDNGAIWCRLALLTTCVILYLIIDTAAAISTICDPFRWSGIPLIGFWIIYSSLGLKYCWNCRQIPSSFNESSENAFILFNYIINEVYSLLISLHLQNVRDLRLELIWDCMLVFIFLCTTVMAVGASKILRIKLDKKIDRKQIFEFISGSEKIRDPQIEEQYSKVSFRFLLYNPKPANS